MHSQERTVRREDFTDDRETFKKPAEQGRWPRMTSIVPTLSAQG